MKIKRLPSGFIIPAQPVLASRPPSGPGWVHEIKRDGYRMIVRQDGLNVRLYSRNAYDWTERLSAIAAAAERIKAKSFTIDSVRRSPDRKGRSPVRKGRAVRAALSGRATFQAPG
jgi:ATP-dependent DNA ligase